MLHRVSHLGILLCLATGIAASQTHSPTPPKSPPAKKPEKAVNVPQPPRAPRLDGADGVTSEKAIAADPNVAIKLCVANGSVKIYGSDRNEVRVFVRDGRRFEFKAREKNPQTGKANWLWITNAVSPEVRGGVVSECLAGESIELDVPSKTSISLEARTAGTEVDSVWKIDLKLLEGNVSLRNIHGGINAETYRGNVTLESSTGAIRLETTSGNVLAYDVSAGSTVGNLFRVKTQRGNIAFQNVEHRQIDADTVTGNVRYQGKLLPGGIYKFKSSSGSVGLLLEADVSARVIAAFGLGSFNSLIPVKVHTETVQPGGKSIVGSIGRGDAATLDLKTATGSIRILKKGEEEIP